MDHKAQSEKNKRKNNFIILTKLKKYYIIKVYEIFGLQLSRKKW